MKAALYIRVNSREQVEHTLSLSSQEADCRAYAARQGWDVTEVFAEPGYSGDDFDRPGLARLREAIHRRAMDIILVWKLDRFSREPWQQELVIAEARAAGVEVASSLEDIRDTFEGEIIRAVLGLVAKQEKRNIVLRTLRGRRARVESGKPLAGQRPRYGYRWEDPDEKSRFVENLGTAAVVRRIYRKVVEGRPLKAVARGLTDDGIPTPRGRPDSEVPCLWHPQRIKEIIEYPGYKGEGYAFVKKTADRKENGRRYKKQTVRPKEDWIRLPDGTIPGLVDAATWQAANDRLAWNKTNGVKQKSRADEALLRGGFVRCGHCGDVMRVFWQHVGKGGYGMSYQCQRNYRRHRDDPNRCSWHTISADELDPAVWERVMEILLKPEIVRREVEQLRGDDRIEADLLTIDRRLTEISREQGRLADRIAKIEDEDAAAPLLAKLKPLSDGKRVLSGSRAALVELAESREARRNELRNVTDWIAMIRQRLERPDGLSPEQKRLALTALGAEVKVWRRDHGGDRYEITFNLLPGTLPGGDPDDSGNGIAVGYGCIGEAGPAGGERWREAGCCGEPAGGRACLARPALWKSEAMRAIGHERDVLSQRRR